MHPLDRGAVPIHPVRQIARIIRNRGQTAVHGRSRQPARPAQAHVDLGRHIPSGGDPRSEENTSELQSLRHLVCRHLLEKKTTSPPCNPAARISFTSSTYPAESDTI